MSIARRWQVYAIFSPETGRPVYVGRTYNDVLARVYSHIHNTGNQPLRDLFRSWALKGETPHVEVLEKGHGDCAGAEQQWIARLQAWGYELLNKTCGGEPTPLLPLSVAAARPVGPSDGLHLRRRYEYLMRSTTGRGFKHNR